ncbi:MAG: hypothetical protein OEY64_10585 [Nitrospinota bacterium]|nr:hypothetical protein [Nitrospinota bacterium]
MLYNGIKVTFLIGQTVPKPAPPMILEALRNVEVKHTDEGMSGFQITFALGKGLKSASKDFALLKSPLLKPPNRMIILVTFNAKPTVLMDGIIQHQQLSPGQEVGSTTLTITGNDVSVMMDKEKVKSKHPAQSEDVIALKLISKYSKYGLTPNVIKPSSAETPSLTDTIPVQDETDFKYLKKLADKFAYDFYIISGPAPGVNKAYWGPPATKGTPQRALSVDMGTFTNVESISFQYDAKKPQKVKGKIQDKKTQKEVSINISAPSATRLPLSKNPSWKESMETTDLGTMEGYTAQQARTAAQRITDRSVDQVVTATGDLDSLRYGNILKPRGLVGLRGVGYSYDGNYYVKEVSHKITREKYKQTFTLTRDGLGALLPVVVP